MTSHGDDCYFFYYSTCTKGDGCLFRHCEAALGSETICSLWREGQCFRAACRFRHMEIPKNRKEIPCFWEKQATGCKKPHCPFLHQKPCYVTENQEVLPCPIHPPVVLNLADDYDDDDDDDDDYDDDDGQFSEDGEDGQLAPSPKKLHKSGDSLNTGVSTGEEIQLQSAPKASMARADSPIQSADALADGEKENISQKTIPPAPFNSRDEAGRPRGSATARLGGKILTTDVKRKGLPLKRSLAERLGGVVDIDLPLEPPQKVFKTMKERFGPISVQGPPAQPADTSEAPQRAPEQICIITFEGIRQEKSQHHSQRVPALLPTPKITRTGTGTVKGPKPIRNVKIVSKTLPVKRKRQEDEPNQSPRPKKAKSTGESPDMKGVRVKTLQEIRREKAARLQVQQATEADVKKSSDSKEESFKRPQSLHIQKLPGHGKQTAKVTPEKTADETMKPAKPAAAPLETTVMAKVKSFEEIMREKRMRMQEAQSKGAADEVSPQSGTPAAPLKRKRPSPVVVSSAGSSAASVPVKPKSSPETSVDTKVQPKLNVKSGNVRRRAKRSAVAVVKPLNSSSTVQETACRHSQHSQVLESFSVKAQLGSAIPGSPSSLLEVCSTSGPLRKKLRTVYNSKESQSQEIQPAANEACAVPQSLVLKSPTRPKSRTSTVEASCSASTGTTSSSAEYDFEELMEISEDDSEVHMEIGVGEDGLLQDLYEMMDC